VTSALAAAIMAILQAQSGAPRHVAADSRKIQPGDVFLAYPGHASDGRQFIHQAIARGASAVLWEREGFDWDSRWNVPNLPVDRLRWMVGDIADEVCGHPSRNLWMVGVTGTNGKTSVSQWVARALNRLERRCAVIGTLGNGFPGNLDSTVNTTPDAIELQESLARFQVEGAQAAAMEVSSIGLDQGRVSGCVMDVAVFTNLTRDHLDYHGTMEAYADAKSKLFDMPGLKAAVLNFDDRMGVSLARRLSCREGFHVLGYSLIPDNVHAAPADSMLLASGLQMTTTGMRFRVHYGEQQAELAVGLVGQFNISNLLAVLGVLLASGYMFDEALGAVRELTPPEGRMQTLGGIGEPLAVVDYAHTPDALEKALNALQHTAHSRGGKLICVFGCGGDRDPGKRPMMGEVAVRLADKVVVTSDNPRNEDPQDIIEQIIRGAPGVECIADRGEAILQAVQQAGPDDVVLIAGKGHEDYQEVKGLKHHFSDVAQAKAALAARSMQKGSRS